MSIHTKERGCVQRSLSHGGAQKSLQKAVLSAFKYLKNCLDGDFVSFPSFRFLRELKTHKIAFCIRVSAIFFTTTTSMFCTTREKLSRSFADRLVRVMFGRNFMSRPSGTAVKMPDGSIF